MQNLLKRQILTSIQAFKQVNKISIPQQRNYSFASYYDPDYLDAYKPDVPEFDTINIQLKGYDYVILENYQKHVHRIAKALELDVNDGWATPGQYFKIQKLKPKTSAVETEYKLCIYERNLQICDLPSTKDPVLLRILQATLPQGVTVNVHEHLDEHEEIRYVPDKELIELKTQLETMATKKD
uniref:Putative 28s ribosomal protein s10 mitochondrial n=1 Tax=Xenopsylla cheopis TaxID=163159 RepID=A0A6M2DMR1_XENCH